jgi:hypothetical protein
MFQKQSLKAASNKVYKYGTKEKTLGGQNRPKKAE